MDDEDTITEQEAELYKSSLVSVLIGIKVPVGTKKRLDRLAEIIKSFVGLKKARAIQLMKCLRAGQADGVKGTSRSTSTFDPEMLAMYEEGLAVGKETAAGE